MNRITTAALTLVVAPVLAAQEPPPPTFKAESQVVVLDVVARRFTPTFSETSGCPRRATGRSCAPESNTAHWEAGP